MSTVGTNLKLSMTPLNCKGITILSDFSTTLKKKETIVNIGDIQSEEDRHIMFKFDLPRARANAGNVGYIDIKLTYINTIAKGSETLATRVIVTRGLRTTQRDVLLDAQYNRVITTKALTDAEVLGEAGMMKEAREVLQRVIEEVQRSISGNHSISKGLIADLESTLKGYKNVAIYENWGHHFGQQLNNCHQVERCAIATDQTQYVTSNQYDVFEDFDASCSQDSHYHSPFQNYRELSPALSHSLELTPRHVSGPILNLNPENREDSPYPFMKHIEAYESSSLS